MGINVTLQQHFSYIFMMIFTGRGN